MRQKVNGGDWRLHIPQAEEVVISERRMQNGGALSLELGAWGMEQGAWGMGREETGTGRQATECGVGGGSD
jgi:hypothetical protein